MIKLLLELPTLWQFMLGVLALLLIPVAIVVLTVHATDCVVCRLKARHRSRAMNKILCGLTLLACAACASAAEPPKPKHVGLSNLIAEWVASEKDPDVKQTFIDKHTGHRYVFSGVVRAFIPDTVTSCYEVVAKANDEQCVGVFVQRKDFPTRLKEGTAVTVEGNFSNGITKPYFHNCKVTVNPPKGPKVIEVKTAAPAKAEPLIVELSSYENCPFCRKIEPDVQKLIQQGYRIQQVDTAKAAQEIKSPGQVAILSGEQWAARFDVTTIPTFVLVDPATWKVVGRLGENKRQQPIKGAEIKPFLERSGVLPRAK